MHRTIDPRVLYFGTPVVIISSENEDGTTNIAPISSAWWLGKTCVIGISTRSKSFANMQRTGQCVLNLPSPSEVDLVDRLALTTGKNPVPEYKVNMGYIHKKDKFSQAKAHPIDSLEVRPQRVEECPVHLEGLVKAINSVGNDDEYLASVEISIVKVHIMEEILVEGKDYIDTMSWSPLLMSFCEFFAMSGPVHPSRLADAWREVLTS